MHYLTFVLLDEHPNVFDGDPSYLESAVGAVLERYQELDLEGSFKEVCWCVGREAKTRCAEMYDLIFPSYLWAGTREAYEFLLYQKFPAARFVDDSTPAYERMVERAVVEPVAESFRKFFEQQPDRREPDPQCAECGGSGETESTFNPQGRWDWYQIGGRWGDFWMRNDPQGNGRYVSPYMRPVSLLKSYSRASGPRGILFTSDEKIEEEQFFSLGLSKSERIALVKRYFRALEHYKNGTAVVVDIHS